MDTGTSQCTNKLNKQARADQEQIFINDKFVIVIPQ
jgi:hypothetical protein